MAFPKRKNIQQRERQLLVVVGSQNPVKINCTDSSFHKVFEEHHFVVQGLNVNSEVSEQPFGDAETYRGAYNRAKNAKNTFPEADYWVGIEGGVDEMGEDLIAYAWVVIIDQQGNTGKSKTSTFFLPKAISNLIKGGMELGDADDQVFNRENSKQGNGAVGILTKSLVNRQEYYEQAVILALIPFVNESIY
ncbi:inosine/xanthosine triphosphatase [Echinicola sp. CAU 1574]|uniref:Probable inosine/xanthosine triphosphatase n=1 Tax=Echinicola arenosa TaxID=2774144 RepID=A0ABR9AJK4_9BACT|nr:inosine/xanthosine triphosphatase [Echinicola arenosa]MBD8488709.1 inosine/xanthosine triphosphatase [Echinicola arenosa]